MNSNEDERNMKTSVTSFIDYFGINKRTWALFFLLAFAMFFDGYDNMIVNFSLPSIQAEWSLNSVVSGSLSSWSLIGLVLGGVVAGPLADKFGRKKVMVGSIALFGILNLPQYFAPNWTFFAVFRVLAGAGIGSCIPMVSTSLAEWMPSRHRAVFITSAMAFMVAGGTAAGLVGGALCDSTAAASIIAGTSTYSSLATISLPFISDLQVDFWRVGFFIGAIPLIYAIILWFCVPETPSWYLAHGYTDECIEVLHDFEQAATGTTKKASALTLDSFEVQANEKKHGSGPAELFSKKYLKGTLAIWIGYFCGCMILYGMNAWLPRLCGALGYSYSLATIMQAASVIANVSTGYIAGKIGIKKNIVIGFGIAAIVLGITTAAVMGNWAYPALCVVMVILGFGINYGQTGLQPLMTATYDVEIRGTGVAWCQAFGRFGGALSPVLLGALLDIALSQGLNTVTALSLCFLVLLVPALLAILAVGIFAKSKID